MGIPGAFRWLTENYDVVGFDPKLPIDNFYIDMNGIIHPVSRGLHNEDQIIAAVINRVKYLVSVARPHKLLYLAIDGVAPKAKMVQQRKRRFMSIYQRACMNDLREKLDLPVDHAAWDTNTITPGTQFMDKLAAALREFARNPNMHLLNGVRIVVSDSNVANEGEHKIIRYIKETFAEDMIDTIAVPASATNQGITQQVDYYNQPLRVSSEEQQIEKKTVHCIHGLDADLIFLTLTCHLPRMYIMREQDGNNANHDGNARPRMQYIDLDKLRLSFMERLQLRPECVIPVMDDWTLITFMLGNDFIPHTPSLHIRFGGMDILLSDIYMKLLPEMQDYLLVRNGITGEYTINLTFLSAIFDELAAMQDIHVADLQSAKFNMRMQMAGKFQDLELINLLYESSPTAEIRQEVRKWKQDNRTAHVSFDQYWKEYEFLLDKIGNVIGWPNNSDEIEAMPEGERETMRAEYRRRFYQHFFAVDCNKNKGAELINAACEDYIRIIQWTTDYYFNSTTAWNYSYGYHVAPLAEDLAGYLRDVLNGAQELTIDFASDLDAEPVNQWEQLLCVLPPQSMHLLPAEYQAVMKRNVDKYPTQIDLDMTDCTFLWESDPILDSISLEWIKRECAKFGKKASGTNFVITASVAPRNNPGYGRGHSSSRNNNQNNNQYNHQENNAGMRNYRRSDDGQYRRQNNNMSGYRRSDDGHTPQHQPVQQNGGYKLVLDNIPRIPVRR